MIINKEQIIKAKSGMTSNIEGKFLRMNEQGEVALFNLSDSPDALVGVAHTYSKAGDDIDIILPGYSGIVGVVLHQSSDPVKTGDRLAILGAGVVGKASSSSGPIVAVAVEAGTPGSYVAARLVEPYTQS